MSVPSHRGLYVVATSRASANACRSTALLDIGFSTGSCKGKRMAVATIALRPDDGNQWIDHAHSAGLRYVRDDQPGIRRIRADGAFEYRSPSDALIADEGTLSRI